MAAADPAADPLVEDVNEVVVFLEGHAEELRRKGLPVDAMIQDLERKIADVLAAARKGPAPRGRAPRTEARGAPAAGRRLGGAPAGPRRRMSTTPHVQGAVEREVARRRRGKKGVGG